MTHSQYDLTLDILQSDTQAVLTARLGDTARRIVFRLTQGPEPYPLDPGMFAVFTAKRPDGTVLFNHCDVTETGISYDFTPQTAAVLGAIPCELQLYRGDLLLTAPRFTLLVEDTVCHQDDLLAGETEATQLSWIMGDLQRLYEELDRVLYRSGGALTGPVMTRDIQVGGGIDPETGAWDPDAGQGRSRLTVSGTLELLGRIEALTSTLFIKAIRCASDLTVEGSAAFQKPVVFADGVTFNDAVKIAQSLTLNNELRSRSVKTTGRGDFHIGSKNAYYGSVHGKRFRFCRPVTDETGKITGDEYLELDYSGLKSILDRLSRLEAAHG